MIYRKSQIGWVILGIIVLTIILLFILFETQWGDNPLTMVPFVIISILLLIILLLFYKLTIEVGGSYLNVIYGIGLIKIKLNIDDLLGTKVIRTAWYYGLGIRFTVMVGTAEPEKLKRVLDENFNRI
nr:hypothetical protein [uncultured Allomuricauda sp.]